jgi:hypothetical protein
MLLVLRGLTLTAGGLAIAFPVALAVRSTLDGFSPWSVTALGLSSAIVMVAAIAAAAQPARRVLGIQPGCCPFLLLSTFVT